MAKNIAILGSTGSIGRQTLDVIDWLNGDYVVKALTGNHNVELLAQQARKYRPELVVLADGSQYGALRRALGDFRPEVLIGEECLPDAATLPEVDVVVGAVSGFAGLPPVLAAIKAGKDIALANKEVLVAAGQLVMDLVQQHQVALLPVDSEHSAIWQCLCADGRDVESLLLTASGGPFRDWTTEQLAAAKPSDALQHPTWAMGKKITIDSATLMNKGLEVIEAHWLFDMPYEKIQVVVHPESIIHSLVRYTDGAILAQLGPHDMRIPIQYALTYPERTATPLPPLDLAQVAQLTFREPDMKRFPCLSVAFEAGWSGGTYPAAMNAANEELVGAYLKEQISFPQIGQFVDQVLQAHRPSYRVDLDDIMEADRWAREEVDSIIQAL